MLFCSCCYIIAFDGGGDANSGEPGIKGVVYGVVGGVMVIVIALVAELVLFGVLLLLIL